MADFFFKIGGSGQKRASKPTPRSIEVNQSLELKHRLSAFAFGSRAMWVCAEEAAV